MTGLTLQELVVEACSKFPHHLAAIFDDGCHGANVVTYRQVLDTANTVTSLLRPHSKHGEIIGLYVEPCINLPACILGILQLPAAYGPIDPHAPTSINEYFIREVGIGIVCVQSCLLEHFANGLGQSFDWEPCHNVDQELMSSSGLVPVRLDTTKHEQYQCDRDGKDQVLTLAYALHTSGTTGRPKIVRVPHSCIVPNILDLRLIFSVTEKDVVFMASPLTFDPSVVEMFMTWSQGATLLIVPTKLKMAPKSLAQVLIRNHVTVLQATPSLISRFSISALQQDLLGASSTLRLLAFGGESCPTPATIACWRGAGNRTEFFNLYGITEVSSWASCFKIPEDWIEERLDCQIPLGDALKDTILQVWDETRQEVISGRGEIFIGGYVRVCFLDNEEPRVSSGHPVMRATGDVVEVTKRGLFFLGRQDDQVKRHGKRISLFHVRQVIESCSEVESCDVIHTDGRLIAFYTPAIKNVTSSPSPGEQQEVEEVARKAASLPLLPSSSPQSILPPLDIEMNTTCEVAEQESENVAAASMTSPSGLQDNRCGQSAAPPSIDSNRHMLPVDGVVNVLPSLDVGMSYKSSEMAGRSSGKQTATLNTPICMLKDSPFSHSVDLPSLHSSHELSTNISELDADDCQVNYRWPRSIRASVPLDISMPSLERVMQPSRSIAHHLRGVLPSHAFPDRFVALQELPITRHGKVNTAGLKELLGKLEASEEKERRGKLSIGGCGSVGEWNELLVQEWKNSLFLAESDAISNCDSFVTLGGDSFQALRLVQSLETSLNTALPDLVDVLLHQTFYKVQQTISQHLQQRIDEGQSGPESHQDMNNRNRNTNYDTEHPIQSSGVQSNQGYASDNEEHFLNEKVDKVFIASISKEIVSSDGQLGSMPTQIASRYFEKHYSNISFSKYPNEDSLKVDSPTESRNTDDDVLPHQGLKRKTRDSSDDAFLKKTLSITPETVLPVSSGSVKSLPDIQRQCIVSVRRGSQLLHHNRCWERASLVNHGVCAETSGVEQSECRLNTTKLCLEERWKVDTGKCVDASPLVVCTSSSRIVYIGSHSHRFVAITMETGNVLWEATLGDRVESSACLSACGKYVIVGCYDHYVYCLSALTGDIYWKYQTGDVVKCSPLCDLRNGLVYIGSHDQHILALQVEEEKCEMKWRSHCGGGSVFASPCIHHATGTLITATLRGTVIALNKESGEKKWSFICPKPVFSSPVTSDDGVLVGCVDGIMYCLSHAGMQLWTCTVDAPIFSSPCVSTQHPLSQPASNNRPPSRRMVVFGSHDGLVTCLDPLTGQHEWTSKVSTSPVYSTPFIFTKSGYRRVAVASTDGHAYILDLLSGKKLNEIALPGEVFSSPVVIEGKHLVVGCRNDYVYCLDWKETAMRI